MIVYRHYKGGLYGVITDKALNEDDVQTVVYVNFAGEYFVQPRERFFGLATNEEGKKLQRFVKLYDDENQEFFTPPY